MKKKIMASLPVTDGHQEIFRCWWKKLEISNVQLFDLNGLAELDDKPEQREGHRIKKKIIKNPQHKLVTSDVSVNLPDFVATGI